MASASSSAAAARISGNRPSDHKTGPVGEPMTPVPSASLVVLCPLDSSSSGSASSSTTTTTTTYTTLMLERSARIGSSFRSAVVFPGGQLDLADEAPYLDRSSNALLECGSKGDKMLEMDIRDEEGYMNALKLCALRETFEEAGLLLMPSAATGAGDAGGMPLSRAVGYEEAGMKKEEWFAIREQVHNDASHFVPFLHRVWSALGNQPSSSSTSSGLPPLAGMTHHSNWVTPRSVVRPAKRFDAHFLITCLDRPNVFGSSPTYTDSSSSSTSSSVAAQADIGLAVDGKEAASLRLGSPRSLLQAAFEDRQILYPPQAYILADLAAHIDSHAAAAAAASSSGSGPRELKCIAPLAFGAARPTADTVTKVEEEARGLGGRNYTWDRKESKPPSEKDLDRVAQGSGVDPSSAAWVSTDSAPFMPSSSSSSSSTGNKVKADVEILRQGVTAIEPHPLIKHGTNVPLSATPEKGVSPKAGPVVGESEDDEEEMFVFPLVLPGDYQASAAQRAAAGQNQSETSRRHAINRLYVSPRSREHGGGLVVKGAKRAGVGALMDFEIGLVLGEEADEDEAGSGQPSNGSKSRL
ncbi:hypothetical protein OC845_004837 [Tilletia horrida]|nr:hypothetical protein OC845_004837 [Tilletia horrida]